LGSFPRIRTVHDSKFSETRALLLNRSVHLETEKQIQRPRNPGSQRSGYIAVIVVLGMIVLPAALTLHQVRISAVVDAHFPDPSPYGYSVSLLLFVIPILGLVKWLVPQDGVKISKKSFVRTLALLVPVGAMLDFFFAHLFLKFPNPKATLGIPAPALGQCEKCHIFIGTPDHILLGSVPLEEYVFYFTGFTFVLLLYIWLDEYWLAAYSVPGSAKERAEFRRLLQFHPKTVVLGVALIAAATLCRHFYDLHHPTEPAGFPGYFLFLVLAALGPGAVLFPAALPVINWRALSLVLFITLLTSLLWEATLGVPYGWWDYQHSQMMGIFVTAWDLLPIEALCVWVAVSFQTVIVYEVVKRWQASGRGLRHALFGE